MEHGNPLRQLHDDLHIVLDDQNRQILGNPTHQFHRVMRLGRAHPGGWFVETQELRFSGKRDADLEIALLAMRKIGGQLPRLAAQADCLEGLLGLLDDVPIGPMMSQQAPAMPP